MDRAVFVLLTVANLAGFTMIAMDKWRARTNRWRTSEWALILPSLAGGWVGTLLAMKTFRHKTRKRSFQYKLALAILTSLGLAGLWLRLR